MGWDQQAGDAAELATHRFAIYVDGTRAELTEVSCSNTRGASGFACSGRLPPLTPGAHSLELATYVADAPLLESARSAPLQVVVGAAASSAARGAWESGFTETTADGLRMRVDKLLDGLEEPVDAAFLPDGRLLIAERTGRVRLVDEGKLQAVDALTIEQEDRGAPETLLSIAVDPDFEKTHFVFVVQTAQSASGAVFRLARYRELRGTLAERAVLLESVNTAPENPAAILRFGPDRKLYLAVGGQASGGKLLRLNLDGTMPRDQAGTTPAIAGGLRFPRGLGWHPRSGILWIADDDTGNGVPVDAGAAHVSGITTQGTPVRAVVRGRHALRGGSGSLAFYSGDVLPGMRNAALIASPDGRHLLSLQFAADDPVRIASEERLLEDRVGEIRVVLTGPDGTVYFCTGDALGRLGRIADH
jgi:glucose/arabinose dehydrogenase